MGNTYGCEETIELTAKESLRLRAMALARCEELDVLSADDLQPLDGPWDPEPEVRPSRAPTPKGISVVSIRRR